MQSEGATFTRFADRIEATLHRTLEHPVDAVWAMLTDSSLLPLWLAVGVVTARRGGAVRLDIPESGTVIRSAVLEFEPLRRLGYSWGRPGEPFRPISWRLAAEGARTRLTLSLRVPAGEDVGRTCGGWEAHLEMLAAALGGAPIPFPSATFRARRDFYRDDAGAG